MLAEALEQLAAANTKLQEVTDQVAQLEAQLAELEAEFDRVMKEKEDTVAEAERMAKKMEMAQRLIAALASENVRWTESVAMLKAQSSLLPGDCLVAASFVSYVGAFNNQFRETLMNSKFMPYIKDAGIDLSDNADPVSLLADDAMIALWNSESLPSDRVSTENGCIITTCARWPLMIDPQLQGIVWVKDREAKNNLLVMRLGQKGMMDKVERAVEGGQPVLIENMQESMEAAMLPVMARQYIRKARKILVKLGDKEVEVHKDFKLVLHTKLGNPHYPPEIQAETTLVNFTVTESGLEDQLLARVVRKERPDLEEQKAALIKQQNEFKIKLNEIEESLLHQLATAEGDLTENIELIENLEESKRVSTDIAEKAKIASQTEIEINIAREEYRSVASRSAMLFFMLNNLFRIHKLYLFSLAAFVVVFERAIDKCETDESSLKERLHGLIENITFVVWHFARRGMFEAHKLIVVTQLTFLIMGRAGSLDVDEQQFLLLGKQMANVPIIPENIAAWMTDSAWAGLHALKSLPAFSEIIDDVSRSAKPWKLWMEDDKAEKQPLPQKWNDKTSLQKLCIIRCLRPDRMTNALDDFVRQILGDRYSDEAAFNMQEVFNESSPANPIFCLLFPGVNPYSDVESAGEAMGYSEVKGNLRRISMGQGQEPIAEQVIDDFSKSAEDGGTGGWVYLDNVHLMSNWLPILERKLEIVADGGHPDCRVICSAEPHPDPHCQWVPQGILENSVKVVNMPPSALQANLRRAYAQFTQADLDSCSKKNEMRSMLFALCYFHACVVGRHKFGAQGWSRKYGFNFGDLTISGKVLVNYLNNNDFVPWDDIKYLQGEVMYGGHITDPWDRRVAIAYLDEYMCPQVLDGHEFQPGFKMPQADEDYEFYKTFIDESFPIETPVLFGLHPNAEIGFLVQSGSTLCTTILELGGTGGGGGAGGADPARGTLDDLENRLPMEFNMYEIRSRVVDETPYVSVVMQECARMNTLLGEMRRSMAELQLGLAGALNMSDMMETLLQCLRLGRVAPNWTKYAYDSLKGLAMWFEDLLLRVEQLKGWSAELTTPVSVWITALFNPMSYITAILQTTARAQDLPLDQMDIWTDVMAEMEPNNMLEYPETGMYIHGLFMEGARWDAKKLAVTESVPKELHPPMPVMHVQGKVHGDYSTEGVYKCPVYTTSMRGPAYVFPATMKSVDKINKWVLAGVCLLMNED